MHMPRAAALLRQREMQTLPEKSWEETMAWQQPRRRHGGGARRLPLLRTNALEEATTMLTTRCEANHKFSATPRDNQGGFRNGYGGASRARNWKSSNYRNGNILHLVLSIAAQRPRVSPPSRPGAVVGLLVPLAHGLMCTHCDEQKRHWYCIMDFLTHTSGSGMAECRAPADERRKKMVRERQKHNGAKQPRSKHLSNSKD